MTDRYGRQAYIHIDHVQVHIVVLLTTLMAPLQVGKKES